MTNHKRGSSLRGKQHPSIAKGRQFAEAISSIQRLAKFILTSIIASIEI
ncbi:MAG: hypothetical protein ABIT35_15580 [Chitinophagaceae bacterium]